MKTDFTPPPQAPDATALVIERLSDANVRIYAHLWGDGKGDRLTVHQYTNIISDITSAVFHLTALQARCVRLEEDKARLDWMETAKPADVYMVGTNAAHVTFRQAIDAARATKEAT